MYLMLKNRWLKTVTNPHTHHTETTFKDVKCFDFPWEAHFDVNAI